MKRLWGWFLGLMALLVGALAFERNRNKKLKLDLENAKIESKDELHAFEQEIKKQKIEEEKAKLAQLEREEVKDLSPKEVEEYWKSKK